MSRLLERVELGEEIVIARAGTPVARLVPIGSVAPRERTFGSMSGQIRFAADYDQADAAVAALFDATASERPAVADKQP